MGDTTRSVFLTEFYLIEMTKKNYTVASNAKMLEILIKIYKIHISERRLQQVRKWLRDNKFVSVKFRWKRYSDGTFKQISSAVALTMKGVNRLIQEGILKAKAVRKRILKWLKKKDGRWPKKEDATARPPPPVRTKDQEKLKDLAGGVFQPF